ncbi:hypothetical protein ACSBR2_015135 [Camellia fascicularis]
MKNLKACGLLDIIFHELDVTYQTSIACLAAFIKTKFNKLDILVRLKAYAYLFANSHLYIKDLYNFIFIFKEYISLIFNHDFVSSAM